MSTLSKTISEKTIQHRNAVSYLIPRNDIGLAFASNYTLLKWWKDNVFDGKTPKVGSSDVNDLINRFLMIPNIKDEFFEMIAKAFRSSHKDEIPTTFNDFKKMSVYIINLISAYIQRQIKSTKNQKGIHPRIINSLITRTIGYLPKAVFNKLGKFITKEKVSESLIDKLFDDTIAENAFAFENIETDAILEVSGADFLYIDPADAPSSNSDKDDSKDKKDQKSSKKVDDKTKRTFDANDKLANAIVGDTDDKSKK